MDLKITYKRLIDEVKKHNKLNNEPSRNEDIAAMMGKNRTYLSDLLGPRGVVTEDHIRTLKLNFPFLNRLEPGYVEKEKPAHKEPAQIVTMDMLKEMIRNTTTMVQNTTALVNTNALLAQTNADQTKIVDRLTSSGGHQRQYPEAKLPVESKTPMELKLVLERIVKEGVGLWWKSEQEGKKLIGNILSGQKDPKKVTSN